jgi:hypothetical protein
VEVVLQVPSGDPVETARYLLYRIQTLWPESLAWTLEDEWEVFSIRGSAQPTSYWVSPSQADQDAMVDLPQRPYNALRVTCEPSRVILRPEGPQGTLVVNQLTSDPLWGPDWLVGARTKVCS